MNFIQFMFPHGRQEPVSIPRPEPIEAMAKELEAAGWRFEIECFPGTQMVSMDCCDLDEQLSSEVASNGPAVPPTVDAMVQKAHTEWLRRGKPKANLSPLIPSPQNTNDHE
jgi:hypothetical protein